MPNRALALAVLAGALLLPLWARAQMAPSLTSVSVELPSDDQMFPGDAAADAINSNCLACHSADMVLNQPALPKATWQKEVAKMIDVYKAPVAPEDVGAIVDYLASTKGEK